MTSYWKKKLEEFEAETGGRVTSSSGFTEESNYWKRKRDEFEELNKKLSPSAAKNTEPPTLPTTEQKRTWFQAGALDDEGSVAKNVAKTVIGTEIDTKENLGAGALGVGEKLVDTLMWLGGANAEMQLRNQALTVASMNNATGVEPNATWGYDEYSQFADSVKKETADFIEKDLYDEEKVAKWIVNNADVAGLLGKAAGVNSETDSVLGEKSDALLQSAGQLGVQIGTSALGVPWWVTSGVSAFGSETENALRNGATFEEAGASGFISAAGEILTERISGGIKIPGMGGTLDDVLTRKLATEISSKFWRTATKMGIDVVGEGLEEVLSEDISAFGQWLTYQDEEELADLLWSEEAMEAKIEAFIGGAVLGGMGSISQVAQAHITGKDYATGLTEDELKVANKVYEETVAKDKADGKRVTFGSKNETYSRVQNMMEKGFIPAEKVEEILGGDSYATYKAAQDEFFNSDDYKAYRKARDERKSLSKLQEEYTELLNMEPGIKTRTQLQREADLKRQLEEIANSTTYRDLRAKLSPEANRIAGLRNQMRSEVMNRVKGTKLAESYAELARRKEKFSVDATNYTNENARKTVETILESGIGDNTTQFHETVDFLARVSEHTGQIFDFTKDELLKGTEHYKEGYITHGFVSDDGKITLNWDSPRALNVTVGHEITHVLEKAGAYKGLREAVFNYAISKEGKAAFNARLKAAEQAYKGKTNTTAEAEVAADLIGEYLFSDYDFVNNLSKTNQNIFMKMFDEVKHLYKMATAGSREAIELEKVRHAFQKAYNENVKNDNNTSNGALLSYEKIGNIGYVRAEPNAFVREDGTRASEREVFDSLVGHKIPFPDGDIEIVGALPGKSIYRELFVRYPKFGGVEDVKQLNSDVNYNIEELIANSEVQMAGKPDHNGRHKKQGITSFDTRTVKFYDGSKAYTVQFDIGVLKNGEKVAYAKKFFGYDDDLTKKIQAAEAGSQKSPMNQQPVADNKVAQNVPVVKHQHSFSSIANSFFGNEDMSTDEFLENDYRDTDGYKEYVEQCLNNMRQSRTDFNEDFAKAAIQNSIDGIVRVAVASKQAGYDILDSATKRDVRDSKKRLLFSSLEPNSDYFTSHDISTICDKRKNFAEIYDEIVRLEEAKGVPKGKRFFDNVDNYFAIHKVMADKGLTTPCRQCYVESMRKNLAPMATAFLELVTETNPDNTKNAQLYHQKGKNKGELKTSNAAVREFIISVLAEHAEYNLAAEDLTVEMLTTADGLAQLRIQAPLVYEAFNSFYGQAKPKMPKQATPFRFGELTALLTDNKGQIKKSLVDKINSTGGFRLQSYSDFQIQNYVDVLQVLFEAGTLGLNGHAYTKVPAFLDATEGTNLKRNISIFMYKDGDEWKLDRNDSFPDTIDQIYERVKADQTGNTSIIAVSQNADMSAWIMANDYVGYGIPFHKSGLKMGTVRDTTVRTEDGREVKGYTGTKDHTKQQTEVWARTTADHKANTKVKNGINIYSFWDFENKDNLSKKELIEKNIKAYINQCELAGYLPKFREYVMDNSKVLNDVLKYSKELGFVSEDATINDISFEYMGYRIPYGYYKFLGDFGMFTPDGSAAPQQTLSLEGYDFDKAVNFFSDAESLRREEILQQFANGKERQEYRSSTLTAEELEQIAKRKRQEVAQKATKTKYSLGYHAGDLGKSEHLYAQGLGRDTGHFGTGTYFVGDVADLAGYNTRNGKAAPIESVDFDKYNLFRPRSTSEGHALHEFLRGVDGYWSRDKDAVNSMDEYESLQAELNDLVYEIEEFDFGSDDPSNTSWIDAENQLLARSKRMMGDSVGEILVKTLNHLTGGSYIYYDGEYYTYDEATREFTYYGEEEILRMLNADAGGWRAFEDIEREADRYYSQQGTIGYEQWDHSIAEIADILGISEQRVREIIADVTNDIESQNYSRDDMLYKDSAATRFMKALGYEGVDVRGLKGLDNTGYGSVIYDLKDEDLARKQEIGTAKYSVSPETDAAYADAVDRGDMDIAQEFVDDAAMSAGYEFRMFHETDADNIHIFDISRGTHGGTDYQTPYGIFTKTSSKNIGLGSKQMALFVKARNTLRVENREDVVNKVPGFAEYYDQIKAIDEKYDALANELEDEEFDALMAWMEEHPDADMDEVFPNSYIIENKPADIDSEKYLAAHKRRVDLMAEWSEKYDAVAVKAKAYITEYLRSNGYDSMYFVVDGGSRGRQTDSLIVLDENQVKSADPVTKDDDGNVIPLSKRFNKESKDTRYSMSPEDELPTEYGNYHVYTKDFGATDPLNDFDLPVKDEFHESSEAITDADAPPEREAETPVEDPIDAPKSVQDKLQAKIDNTQAELDKNRQYREQALNDFDEEIARLQEKYDSKKNKNTRTANGILRSIERLKRLRANTDADYSKRISDLEAKVEKMSSKEYRTAEQRRTKMQEHTDFWETLLGDTSTWKDMALGIAYKTKTLRRILRTVVRGADGKPDIAKADAIYDALETKYDHNEAQLKKESVKLKEVFKKLNLNHAEDTYAHMLGEFRHNPETTLTEDVVNEFYEKHKKQIDVDKVNSAITEARKTFDDLIVRVNEVLREQGMKEIPYRQGYFPHFTNPKQNWVQKLFNWKPVDNEIPTSIAGITEMFDPQRSWQGFNKQRTGDTTDYSLYQGLDTYIHGALDWIYHIDDLQSRRALENHIRYVHSEEGIKARIDEIKANETYNADEAQTQIEAVLAEARNPLNNLVTELRARTNTLANKKSSMDRGMEEATNRKIYSTMTNLNNRINANMVVGSISSALTNFIPIVQSWHQVSPAYTVQGVRDLVRSAIKDDGMVAKSDFLTNRLIEEEKLYQTGWDKVADKAAWMMNVVDNIASQTVWRSKYLQNMHEGMSEAEAIKDADQFAKNVIAGRSRGNQPSIFDSKNPLIKMATAFQLEVANQYGFMFEDTPQDVKSKARLVKGYATAFVGAYVYNALYSSLVGRDAAFDPISIFEDLFRDLGLFGDDDEEEPEDIVFNLVDNVLDELPYVSGFTGGGRIPLSSAIPYDGDVKSLVTDIANDEVSTKELLKPLYYLALPVGGGQIKKTVEGLSMFDDDLPVSGSYTDSGKLRFPVEDTFGNKVQAALFGQYASKNARDYFDNERTPLGANQIKEYQQLDIPIRDYWEIREGLADLDTTAEKIAYIGDLDLPIRKQNWLANNIVDRKTPIDMTDWDKYGSYEEFDFAEKNPEKYDFLVSEGISVAQYNTLPEKKKEAYDWAFENPGKYAVSKAVTDNLVEYREYATKLNDIRADKNASGQAISGSAKTKKLKYINSLDLDYGAKLILFKSEYPSDNTYNREIIDYLNDQPYTFDEKAEILRELGFTVSSNGTVRWK